MSNIIDELITRFTLDDKQYADATKKVVSATHQAGEAFDQARDKAAEFGKAISEKFKFGEVLAPLAALATAGGIIELGKDAMDTAEKFGILERKIAGLTHSYREAKQQMAFSERESGLTGLFKPEELDEGAVALDRFGLSVQKYLPLIEALSAVTGEGMEQFADALGMLANGEGGRALRVLERAGITVQDLKRRGVAFSGPNEISSPPARAMEGIAGAVQDKFGGVLGEMMNSPLAKTMRLKVAWVDAMRSVGESAEHALLPAVTALSSGISRIVDSGQMDRIVNGFAKLFSFDGSGLKGMLQSVADVFEGLPNKIRKVGEIIADTFGWLRDNLPKIAGVLAAIWATDKVLEFGMAAIKIYQGIAAVQGVMVALQTTFDALTGVGWALIATAVVAGAAAYVAAAAAIDNATASINEFFAAEQNKTRQPAPGLGKLFDAMGGLLGGGKKDDQQTQYLQQIATNTKQSATDLRRYALGGGDLGRIGVTPMEMQRFHGSNHGLSSHGGGVSGGHGQASRALFDAIDQYVSTVLDRQLGQHMNSGVLPNR